MASIVSSEENLYDSLSERSPYSTYECSYDHDESSDNLESIDNGRITNVVKHVQNREIYGRFTKHNRAKTEKVFKNIHPKCRFPLSSLFKAPENMNHVFMGFTLCGKYFLSFTEKIIDDLGIGMLGIFNPSYEYDLHLWRFTPGLELQMLCKYKIFKHLQGSNVLDKILFMQFPSDPHKVICYGLTTSNAAMAYITILTLPSPNSCKHCKCILTTNQGGVSEGWCTKHGFILHYMFSMTQPFPTFNPHISLSYPDHLVINTGHYIHILSITTVDPPQTCILNNLVREEEKSQLPVNNCNFNDTLSEVSESTIDHFETNSIVDAILEDFNEYDMEGSECNKPFHELNISCEPLNVTGKSYHNTLVQNIVDPRLKRLQNNKEYSFSVPQSSGVQKNMEKTKLDIKNAEKAYEFTEENEKCEKLSSFRKKRLAEKKYEFSEDNSENIVPFNSLRKERRFFHRSRYFRSPDFTNLFLSPRSPSMRSPMQSPSSRSGQFSPSGARNLYCTSLRNSPHHSKSPVSPKESARKFSVYSPSLDSDCSDSDSRLVLKLSNNTSNSQVHDIRSNQHTGLLIVDPAREKPKWIKKVVRRYSNGDFENSSLLSGQSRDDYNIPIEIPLIVHTLTEQQLDAVPDYKLDHITQLQLIVNQRTFDCEQFVQGKALQLCAESHLQFLHCEDYDVKIIYICPIDGHVICKAVIKIGALKNLSCGKPETYCADFIFSWNIVTDSFKVIESTVVKLQPLDEYKPMAHIAIPRIVCQKVLVMDYYYMSGKTVLRDYNNYYEICLGDAEVPFVRPNAYFTEDYNTDDDFE